MTGFIYLIRSNAGFYKVGYSADPQRRLAGLQTGSPYQLTMVGYLPGTVAQEQAIHTLLAPWRVAGEWFKECAGVQHLAAQFPAATDTLHPLAAYSRRTRKSLRTIAIDAGCCRLTLYRIMRGEQNATIGLLQRVSEATGGAVPVSAFLPVAA